MDATQVSVHNVVDVGADTIAITFETPEGFSASPGEFVLVRATVGAAEVSGDSSADPDGGEEIARHYTLSSPYVDETFEITVGIDPDGDLTPYLADLEPGDEVEIEGPFGSISYDGEGDVVVLAGGPGVGPALSIGERARADGNDAAIVYLDETPAHEDRLADLAGTGAAVTLVGDEEWFHNAVEAVADAGQVYVFGFRDFCDLAIEALEAAGVDPDDAQIENFG